MKFEERLKEFEQLGSILDKHCKYLLALFDIDRTKPRETTRGFNELHRMLGKKMGLYKPSFTRQTLSLHLKHLLEKKLIEVKEDTESNLKIKPRRYKSSNYWNELVNDISPIPIPKFEQILKDLSNADTETLTALLLGVSAQLCIEIFDRSLTFPEFFTRIERDYVYEFIENMAEAYRSIVLEREEKDEASRAIKAFDDFYLLKIKEKYGSMLERKIGLKGE